MANLIISQFIIFTVPSVYKWEKESEEGNAICLEYRSSSEGEERGSEFSSKANSGIEETKKLSKKDTSRRDSRYVQLFQNIPLDCRVYSEKSL